MKTISFLIFLILIFTSAGFSQTRGGRGTPLPKVKSKSPKVIAKKTVSNKSPMYDLALLNKAEDIMNENPEITDEILSNDIEVINASINTIESKFYQRDKNYFNSIDVREAMLSGWQQLRSGRLKPQEPLTTELYTKYVTSLGKLIVKSDPDGATVEVNNEKLKDPTNNSIAWLSPGSHTIKICKPEYNCEIETGKIEEGEVTVVEKNLSPIKRNNMVKPPKAPKKPN